jgi:RNA polymerase sigma factor (sigma-70 family)
MSSFHGRLDPETTGQIRQLLERGSATGLTEPELLDRFVRAGDDSAFALLVERHGPMVLSVCRRFLSDPNDVDDAFQATFLVLVRKAAGLRRKELLGNWLYGVACRVAQRARAQGAWRRSRLASADRIGGLESWGSAWRGDAEAAAMHRLEEGPLIHEEINRLPQKYRTPILLCYFEGLSHDEAATRLGWPVGTVKGRLSRARDLLRPRLARRGVAVSSATLAAALASLDVRAAVPEGLARATLRSALAVADPPTAAIAGGSAVSVPVLSLTEGVLHAMFLAQVRLLAIPAAVAAGVVVLGAALGGSLLGAQFFGQAAPRTQRPAAAPDGPQPKPRAVQPAQHGPPGSGAPGGQPVDAQPKATAPAPGAPDASGPQMPPPGGMMAGMMGEGQFGGGGYGGGGGADESDPAGTRIMIARMAARISTTDKNPRNQAILKKLDEPITLHFPTETPLSELLTRIKQASKAGDGKAIPIYIDPTGLQEAEKTTDSPVIIDLEDVPLRFSLRLALKQLGLAYCVRDGVLIISSVDGIHQELMEAQAEQIGLHPEQFPMQGMSGMMGRMGRSGSMGGMGGMGGQGGFM